MRWIRNPWLGSVLVLAALVIYARAETPLAALAIGLPFAIVVWAYWCFGQRMSASKGIMATPPGQLFPKGVGIVIVVLTGVWFAYMCYGLFTEKGVIGWLNAVQGARDGKFSTKLSFIVALWYLFCALGVIGLAGAWFGRDRGLTSMGNPAATLKATRAAARPAAASPRDPTRMALWMLIGLVVAAWVIGYPVYLWIAAEHREDSQARYVSVALSASRVVWPQDPHVSLDGQPKGDQVLVLKEGDHARKTFFVPVTGASWTPTQPVSAVLTFVAEVPPRLDNPILGRVRSDALPLAAIDAFARSGVQIDPAHRLIDLIPSQQGRVLDRSDADRQNFLLIATLVSVLSLLLAFMVWLTSRFKRRAAKPT